MKNRDGRLCESFDVFLWVPIDDDTHVVLSRSRSSTCSGAGLWNGGVHGKISFDRSDRQWDYPTHGEEVSTGTDGEHR